MAQLGRNNLLCDRDGSFAGHFVEELEKQSVTVTKVPAEAHWQSGRIEASHRLWRYLATRVIDREQLAGVDDMRTLGIVVSQAKNSRVRQCGASAYQWTFGKDPEVPSSLMDGSGDLGSHSAEIHDPELVKRTRIRAAAEIACIEWDSWHR